MYSTFMSLIFVNNEKSCSPPRLSVFLTSKFLFLGDEFLFQPRYRSE
jgi:hypothetical protein